MRTYKNKETYLKMKIHWSKRTINSNSLANLGDIPLNIMVSEKTSNAMTSP
jgi:hypothetical protein